MSNDRPDDRLTKASHFELRTLGSTTLYRTEDGHQPASSVSLGGKQFGVVAYLACAPARAVSRATLVSLFGPESPRTNHRAGNADERVGAAFRNLLKQLRSKLAQDAFGPLSSDPLVLTASLTCDRDAFLEALERRDFASAIEHYNGDFLPRLEHVASSEFAQWVEIERANLRSRFAKSAQRLLDEQFARAPDREALRNALQVARRFRDFIPDSQQAWQALIRALILSGRDDEAAAEAERLIATLRAGEVEPEPATRTVVALTKKKHGISEQANGKRDDRAHRLFASLVGREGEVNAILEAWYESSSGALRHIHFVAPAGLGKSRLLADARKRIKASAALDSDVLAVEVRASQASRAVAYAFAADVARTLAESPGGLGVSDWAATALIALNPALSSAYRTARAPTVEMSDKRGETIVPAVRELIAAVALEGPLAIFLDDLHWADTPSIHSLAEVLRGCAELPILLISASRHVCGALCAATGGREIFLDALDRTAIDDALAQVAQVPAADWWKPLGDALLEATAGSPLILIDTIRLLTERSLLVPHGGTWHAPHPDGLFAELKAADPTRRRLDQLTPTERRLLLLLSIARAPLSAGRLRSAAGESANEFNSSITSLERRGLVTSRGNDWSISHDEHGRALLESTTSVEQIRAAAKVGLAIAADAGDDLQELRRAGGLLARAGVISGELNAVFERFVRLSRSRGDRRSTRALAGEYLGEVPENARMARSLVRQLPMRLRLVPTPRSHRIATALATILMLILGSFVAVSKLRSAPPAPDAILVASKVATDHVEFFPIPLDAGHLAGIGVIDVRPRGRPWRLPRVSGNGGSDLRPDHHGWTFGVAVPDSGVIDIFDFDLEGHERRLTFARSDDYQPSWSPDNRRFVFVTARWSQHGHYDLAVYDTLTHQIQHLTSGDDTDWEPRWSPDGSRIGFEREYVSTARRALCVIDADGSNLHCLPPDTASDVRLGRWADAHRVFVSRTVGSARQLARMNVDNGSIDLVDDRGADASISPDGKFAVCLCPRQGYPSGTWIVYPVERPNEFSVLRVADADSANFAFSWSPSSPRLPFLHRLTIAQGLGPPLLGVAYQLRASGTDSVGRAVAPGIVRWSSEDTSIATIDSTGLLRPRRAGRATIVASAGGWRTSRTTITIAESTTRVLLDEDWTTGLAPRWRTYGVPSPLIVADTQLGHAFLNNGDGAFFSGAYTRQAFDTRGGLWIAANLSTPLTSIESQDLVLWLFTITDSLAWAKWDHVTGDGPPGASSPGWAFRYAHGARQGRLGEQFLISEVGKEQALPAPAFMNTGKQYRLVMQILPDGRCGLAIDGKTAWMGSANYFHSAVRLMLMGNSVGTRLLVGRVRVSTGIAPEFKVVH